MEDTKKQWSDTTIIVLWIGAVFIFGTLFAGTLSSGSGSYSYEAGDERDYPYYDENLTPH
ncbi:hypothetical protein LCGC14_1562940 [marine sediment metagenome]|uniref:Uncharacterized protein n=1 Tax=marine sediment metagenome TaxID=412755 RepID=A0A0F9LML3_9ZZZZ